MSDLNNVTIVGRFTKDPELKFTADGKPVLTFSLAVNRNYGGAEKKEQVSFFNCVAWNKTAETIAQYFKKGHRIGIEGSLTQRSYEDKTGAKKTAVEIVVSAFQFLQPKDGAQTDKKGDVDFGVPF